MRYLTYKLTLLSKKNIHQVCAMLGMSYGVYHYKLKKRTLKLKDIERIALLFPEVTLNDFLLSNRIIKKMDRVFEKKKAKERLPGQYPHNTILKPVKKPVSPQSLEQSKKAKELLIKANEAKKKKRETNWFSDV